MHMQEPLCSTSNLPLSTPMLPPILAEDHLVQGNDDTINQCTTDQVDHTLSVPNCPSHCGSSTWDKKIYIFMTN